MFASLGLGQVVTYLSPDHQIIEEQELKNKLRNMDHLHLAEKRQVPGEIRMSCTTHLIIINISLYYVNLNNNELCVLA